MIELSFLGSSLVTRGGESSDAILVQPRRLALLAYLGAAPNELHRRDRLLLLFWGEQPETRARASLRQALYFIRRALGDDVLVTRGDGEVGLNPEVTSSDVGQFERAIRDKDFASAMALYRGDFLADFNIDDAPEFERWASERQRGLRRSANTAAWALSDSAAESGDQASAVQWAQRAVTLGDYGDEDVRRASDLATLETQSRVADALVMEKSTPSQTTSPQPPDSVRRSRRSLLVVAAYVVALLGTVALIGRFAKANSAAHGNDVVVLPFMLRSRTQEAAYLRDGTATLLGLALDGAGSLRTVDPNAVLSAAPEPSDLDAGRRVAQSFGAGRYVFGEIQQAGARLSIVATMYDQNGSLQTRASAQGDESHLFELVDTLARQLAIGTMKDSSVRLATVAATSSSSIAAFKSFLAGESAMRAGHYRDAVTSFQAAVAADSSFGLAYYRLSLAREWTDGEISSDSAAALAEHFASHLPLRDRKLLAARRAFVRRDEAEADRLSSEVLDSYPEDADAWLQLAEVKFHLGPNAGRNIDQARVPFLNVLRYRPNDLSARVHLVRLAARDRDTAHLDEWSGRNAWLGDASEVGTFELAAMRATVLGDAAARDTVIAAARRASDRTLLAAIWRLAIYSGDPDAALWVASLRKASRGTEPTWIPENVAQGRIAPLPASDGDVAQQQAVLVGLMLALPSAPELPALAQRAQQQLRRFAVGADTASEPARVALRVLEARYPSLIATPGVAPSSSQDAGTVMAVTGALRLLPSDPKGAARLVDPARLDGQMLMRDRLFDLVASIRAESEHRLGHEREALAWLSSIGMNSAGVSSGIALATRRRAEIEKQQGALDAARRDDSVFAHMWQSSDADVHSLVGQARAKR